LENTLPKRIQKRNTPKRRHTSIPAETLSKHRALVNKVNNRRMEFIDDKE